MIKNIKYSFIIISSSLLMNTVLTYTVKTLNISFLFMDSIGTILSAVLLGPILGAIVGILSNLILSFIIDYSYLYYALINASIGIITGLIVKKYEFNLVTSIICGIILSIIATIIGTPISLTMNVDIGTATVNNFVNSLIITGTGIRLATLIARICVNTVDKILSCIIIFVLVEKVPFFNKKNYLE